MALMTGHEMGLPRTGKEKVLLMLPGYPDDYTAMIPLAEKFEDTHRIVMTNLPDYDKESPTKKGGYEAIQVLEALERLVADVTNEGQQVTLVVHDWGCYFGYNYAKRNPSKVNGVVAFDVGASVRPIPGAAKESVPFQVWIYQAWFILSFLVGNVLGYGVGKAVLTAFLIPAGYFNYFMPRDVKLGSRLGKSGKEAGPPPSWMAYVYYYVWKSLFGFSPHRLGMPMPKCPLLYIYGNRKTFMFHSKAFLAACDARDDALQVGLYGGHWVQLDQLDETVNLMEHFFKKSDL